MNFTRKSMLASVILSAICLTSSVNAMQKSPVIRIGTVENTSTKPVIFRVAFPLKAEDKSLTPGEKYEYNKEVLPGSYGVYFIIHGRKPAVWTLKTIGDTKLGWEKDKKEIGERTTLDSDPAFNIVIGEDAIELKSVEGEKQAAPAKASKITYKMDNLSHAIDEAKAAHEKFIASPAKDQLGKVIAALEKADGEPSINKAAGDVALAKVTLDRMTQASKDPLANTLTKKLTDMLADILTDYKAHAA